SDGAVSNSGFLRFCERLGAADNFIKSASYLLHSANFSKVRDFLLAQSATVLQDDSGIPVHYFAPGQWELRPFGHYVGPIRIFSGRYQSRLRNIFRRAPPIDFGVGYRWRLRESNLLLAEKTEQVDFEANSKRKVNALSCTVAELAVCDAFKEDVALS